MINQIQKVSIKALFCDQGRILMMQEKDGSWELPGGKVEFGEHPRDTLKRELGEELSMSNFTIGEVVDVWDFTRAFPDTEYHFVIVIFECTAPEYKIVVSDEHVGYKWLDLAEIETFPMKDGFRTALVKYLNNKK